MKFSHPNVARLKIPFRGDAQCWRINTTWNVDTLGEFVDVLKWTLNTVEDRFHDARTKFHGQRLACS